MGEVRLNISSNINELISGIDKLDQNIDELNNDISGAATKSKTSILSAKDATKALNEGIDKLEKNLKGLTTEWVKLGQTGSKMTKEQRARWVELNKEIEKTKSQLNDLKTRQADLGGETTKGTALFQKLGTAIAGAFSVYAVVNFAKQAVKAWDDQEKANKKLLVALKGNEAATKRLINQSNQLAKVTLFQDEDIVNAQAMLAALIKDADTIEDLMPLVADLAQAKGMDLASAADLVAKSVGGEVNALGRYGIKIEGAIGSNERLQSAMDGLNKAFGGQAVAAAETGAAAVQQLSKAWGEFAESIGYLIGPALTKLAKGLTDVTIAATDFISEDSLTGWEKLRIFLAGIAGDYTTTAKIIGNNYTPATEQATEANTELSGAIEKTAEQLAAEQKAAEDAEKARFDAWKLEREQILERIALDEAIAETRQDGIDDIKQLMQEEKDYYDKVTKEAEEYAAAVNKIKKAFGELVDEYRDEEAVDDIPFNTKAIFDQIQQIEQFGKDHPIWAALGLTDEDQIQQVKDAASQIFDIITEMVDQQVDASERLVEDLNQRINEQEQLINREFELKQDGLANNYAIEEENLAKMQKARDKAIKDREKQIKIQRTLSTIESSISLITAAANIMKGFSSIPVVGVALGIIAVGAMIAAFIAAQSSIKDATQMARGGEAKHGLLKGKRHSEGGIPINAEEGEFFTNRKSSQKYLPLLEAINKDDRSKMQLYFDRNFITRMPTSLNGIDYRDNFREVVRELKRGKSEIIYGDGFYIEKLGNYTKRVNLNAS